jgi:hypothetical protein
MSLAKLASKAKNAGKGVPKSKSAFVPRRAEPTHENYSFDFCVNYRDVEKFTRNKKLLSAEIGSKFGDAATVIDYGVHKEFNLPDIDPADLQDPNTGEIRRIQFQAETQNVVKSRQDYDNKCAQIYHIVWSKCTISMQNAIKQDPDFDDYDLARDPVRLWLRIVDISLNGIGLPENDEKKINEARHRFDRIAQKKDETVGLFYERFNVFYDAMVNQGAQLYQIIIPANVPADIQDVLRQEAANREEKAKAMAFLNKLDKSRFGGMLDELDNAYQNNRDEYPDTLVQAFNKASRYKKDGRFVDGMMSSKQEIDFSAVYATVKEEKGKQSNKEGKEKICWICEQTGHIRGLECKALVRSLSYFAKKGKSIEQLVKDMKDGVAL